MFGKGMGPPKGEFGKGGDFFGIGMGPKGMGPGPMKGPGPEFFGGGPGFHPPFGGPPPFFGGKGDPFFGGKGGEFMPFEKGKGGKWGGPMGPFDPHMSGKEGHGKGGRKGKHNRTGHGKGHYHKGKKGSVSPPNGIAQKVDFMSASVDPFAPSSLSPRSIRDSDDYDESGSKTASSRKRGMSDSDDHSFRLDKRLKLDNEAGLRLERLPSDDAISPSSYRKNSDDLFDDNIGSGMNNLKKTFSNGSTFSRNSNSNKSQQQRKPVKIIGLPWSATEESIVQFFTPLDLDENRDISILNGANGKPTGEAFVYFKESQLNAAFKYNNQMLQHRYLEVVRVTDEEIQETLDKSGCEKKTLSEGVIRVRGLPFSSDPKQVAGLFTAFKVQERDVIMAIHKHGPRAGSGNGESFIRFSSESLAKTALKNMQNATLGSRYLELFPSSEKELQNSCYFEGRLHHLNALKNNNADVIYNEKDGHHFLKVMTEIEEMDDEKGWLRLRGLPFQSGPIDIVNFVNTYATFPVTSKELEDLKELRRRLQSSGNINSMSAREYIESKKGEEEDGCGGPNDSPLSARTKADTCDANSVSESGGTPISRTANALDNSSMNSTPPRESSLADASATLARLESRGLNPDALISSDLESLQNLKIMERDVFIKYGRFDCKPKGECVVCLHSRKEAELKQQLLDRQLLSGRYIEVFCVAKAEVINCMSDREKGKGKGKGDWRDMRDGKGGKKGRGKGDSKGGRSGGGRGEGDRFLGEPSKIGTANSQNPPAPLQSDSEDGRSVKEIQEWNAYCMAAWEDYYKSGGEMDPTQKKMFEEYQEYMQGGK